MALKRVAAVITAAAESKLWVGPELVMEISSRTLITSLVVIRIFAVMNLQVHSIIFHMVSPALVPAIVLHVVSIFREGSLLSRPC